VGKWLSDWHLVSFLCYQGLFTLVCLTPSCQQELICRRNRRFYVELQQLMLTLKTTQPWKNYSTVTAGRLFSRSQNPQVSPVPFLRLQILTMQEADIMEMDKETILHPKHSMILGLIRLLVVPVVGVGVMVDPGSVLIVLLSMRVVGRIVISVDYPLVDRQEQLKRHEVSHVYVHQHAYIMIHNILLVPLVIHAYWATTLPSTAANCSLNPLPINILLISWVPAPTV